jgi:hypothetical protein
VIFRTWVPPVGYTSRESLNRHYFVVCNDALQQLHPLRPEDRENRVTPTSKTLAQQQDGRRRGPAFRHRREPLPALRLTPQASANFRSPLKSPAFAVALALTSIPINGSMRHFPFQSQGQPRSRARTNPAGSLRAAASTVPLSMVMNSRSPATKSRTRGGLASLARPRNHDDRRVLERGGH